MEDQLIRIALVFVSIGSLVFACTFVRAVILNPPSGTTRLGGIVGLLMLAICLSSLYLHVVTGLPPAVDAVAAWAIPISIFVMLNNTVGAELRRTLSSR